MHNLYTERRNRATDRAFAFAASTSRFFGVAVVAKEFRSAADAAAIASTAASKAAWFAAEGLAKPLIFLTYWSAAARISDSVAGGSKLYRVLMFRHIGLHLYFL